MKKHLLKALLICLGATLLCGMSSFRTPEDMKIQQGYQTAAITNDTIITSVGEESECIKEVVEESCTCSLYVEKYIDGSWTLWLKVEGNNTQKHVKVRGTYYYKENYDGDEDIVHFKRIINGNQTKELKSGTRDSACRIDGFYPCFLNY